MGTFNANIYPATSGLNLGNSGQKWDAALRNLTVDNFLSGSVNVAAAGSIRLASADTIAFRNAANSADVSIAKTQAAAGNVPADTLTFSGGGIEASAFITSTINPASTGVVRLAAADAMFSRNQANSADINLINKDTDDSVIIGDALGAKSNFYTTRASNPATQGLVRAATGDTVSFRNSANSGNLNIGVDASNHQTFDAAAGLLLTGAAPNVLLGGTGATAPMLKNTVGTPLVEVKVADDSAYANLACLGLAVNGALSVTSLLSSYNGVTTDGNGQAIIVQKTTLPSSAAAIPLTTFYTTTTGGMYRLSYHFLITAAGNAVNLAGIFGWTDRVAVAHTATTANIACATLGANSCIISQNNNLVFTAGVGTAITYQTTLSGAIGAGGYRTSIILEYIGTD